VRRACEAGFTSNDMLRTGGQRPRRRDWIERPCPNVTDWDAATTLSRMDAGPGSACCTHGAGGRSQEPWSQGLLPSKRPSRTECLLDLADQVVRVSPPAHQPRVIAAAFAGDRKDVSVIRLAEALVSPDDYGIVAVEVAESAPAGLTRPVRPRSFSSQFSAGAVPPRTLF
jgi:hypothetical protein